jgi:hypothetical protein
MQNTAGAKRKRDVDTLCGAGLLTEEPIHEACPPMNQKRVKHFEGQLAGGTTTSERTSISDAPVPSALPSVTFMNVSKDSAVDRTEGTRGSLPTPSSQLVSALPPTRPNDTRQPLSPSLPIERSNFAASGDFSDHMQLSSPSARGPIDNGAHAHHQQYQSPHVDPTFMSVWPGSMFPFLPMPFVPAMDSYPSVSDVRLQAALQHPLVQEALFRGLQMAVEAMNTAGFPEVAQTFATSLQMPPSFDAPSDAIQATTSHPVVRRGQPAVVDCLGATANAEPTGSTSAKIKLKKAVLAIGMPTPIGSDASTFQPATGKHGWDRGGKTRLERYSPDPSRTLIMEAMPKKLRDIKFLRWWVRHAVHFGSSIGLDPNSAQLMPEYPACARRIEEVLPEHIEINERGKALLEFPTHEMAQAAFNSPRMTGDDGRTGIRVRWYARKPETAIPPPTAPLPVASGTVKEPERTSAPLAPKVEIPLSLPEPPCPKVSQVSRSAVPAPATKDELEEGEIDEPSPEAVLADKAAVAKQKKALKKQRQREHKLQKMQEETANKEATTTSGLKLGLMNDYAGDKMTQPWQSQSAAPGGSSDALRSAESTAVMLVEHRSVNATLPSGRPAPDSARMSAVSSKPLVSSLATSTHPSKFSPDVASQTLNLQLPAKPLFNANAASLHNQPDGSVGGTVAIPMQQTTQVVVAVPSDTSARALPVSDAEENDMDIDATDSIASSRANSPAPYLMHNPTDGIERKEVEAMVTLDIAKSETLPDAQLKHVPIAALAPAEVASTIESIAGIETGVSPVPQTLVPPSAPRAMKNVPKGPSFHSRTKLQAEQASREPLQPRRNIADASVPPGTALAGGPTNDQAQMEDNLRRLVLESQRARLLRARTSSPPGLRPPGAQLSDGTAPDSASSTSPRPEAPSNPSPPPNTLESLATSFIAETIQTLQEPRKTSNVINRSGYNSPAAIPQPYRTPNTPDMSELANKQRQLEQHIAETKQLMSKLSAAKTKEEKDKILALLRERRRCVTPSVSLGEHLTVTIARWMQDQSLLFKSHRSFRYPKTLPSLLPSLYGRKILQARLLSCLAMKKTEGLPHRSTRFLFAPGRPCCLVVRYSFPITAALKAQPWLDHERVPVSARAGGASVTDRAVETTSTCPYGYTLATLFKSTQLPPGGCSRRILATPMRRRKDVRCIL